ncbi:radical SAM protein [candidate division WOR-1 bacterium RIFCSPLOWO2_02_FULL_46_20]|uniref:Radical SAM protein n=1 Tax=candidate division WOR-1 bacterium RIFCSPLOWO2_02_FULL_46_20 TaxID=1802567 RepID=A0A1F4R8F9_UNCSA|nr:MAG: radical SAM protein [candidate division WOR-1 bacterium RIFCSPHIGHO2_02_FULL_45_12]OGC04457.1 MAG: radical SAM protein [candidate division WOR-1 bacterium RIFCSPLOWO2_02_FULL_46_20]
MQSITYPIGDSLYLNITNRCTNECSFCIRNKATFFNGQHQLWLDHEPSIEEIIKAIGDHSKYKQIVFCGYGEPLIRLDVVREVSKQLKSKIRIDTNGHANLFWGKNILPELNGLIDFMSISLDAENAEVYERICRPAFGKKAYPAVIEFIKEAKKYVPNVEASVVDLPAIDKKACEKIAQKLGVSFRVRSYYEETYVR